MPRRALPYKAESPKPRGLPMDAPTREFANHLKSNVMQGIDTRGNLAMVVQVQAPHDVGEVRGTVKGVPASFGTRGDPFINSNTVTGGVVKGYITSNDSIRKAYLIARNTFSPSSHPGDAPRLLASSKVVFATKPTKDIRMPKKIGRGTGGNYTIPYPQVIPQWPTSSEWLAEKVRRVGLK